MTLYNGRVAQVLQGVSQQPQYVRAEGQVGEQINCISDIMQGLRRRPGFALRHALPSWLDTNNLYTTYMWERGDGLEAYLLIISASGDWIVYDLYETEYSTVGTICQSFSSNATSYITTTDPRKDLVFHTIADTTFIVNKTVTCNAGAVVNDTYNGVLVWAKRSMYGKEYVLKYNGVAKATHTNPSVITVDPGDVDKSLTLSTKALVVDLAAQAQVNNYAWDYHKNVMSLNCSYATAPYVASTRTKWKLEDDGNGEDVVLITNHVNTIEDLPPFAPHGYQIEITGLGQSNFDNFWVKFVKDDPSDGVAWDGHWQECAAPGTKRSFGLYMPITLVRTWTGTTPTFTLNDASWDLRAAGDDDTNPYPSFVDHKITDITSYQNRLVVSTGENICMTRAFRYFDWFAESVSAPNDDDPVDSASSDNQITNLQHLAVFNGDLYMFSKNAIFTHDGAVPVRAATFAVSSGKRYPLMPSLKPVVMGKSLIFPSVDGTKMNMMEAVVDPVSGKPDIASLTTHCASYIPNGGRIMPATLADVTVDGIECLATHPTKGLLFCASGGDIYVLQLFYKVSEKVQVAWHKWEFGRMEDYIGWAGGQERPTISDVHILDDTLFAVVRYDGNPDLYVPRLVSFSLNLESMTSAESEIFLDQWRDYDVEYSADPWNIGTEWYNYRAEVPFTYWDNEGGNRNYESYWDTALLMSTDPDIPTGRPLAQGYNWERRATGGDPDYVYFNIDGTPAASDLKLRLGIRFLSSVELSKPYPKDGRGNPYTEDAVWNDIEVDFSNTGYAETAVDNAAGAGYSQVINGMILNSYASKLGINNRLNIRQNIPICNIRELATVTIKSDHWLGFHVDGYTCHLDMASNGRRT